MDFRENLPFKSYGVKKPIANELELTASRALPGSTKSRNNLSEKVASDASYCCKQAMPDSEPPTVGLRLSAPLNVSAHVVIKDQRRACVEAVPRGDFSVSRFLIYH